MADLPLSLSVSIDVEENLADDTRNVNLLIEAMNSIMSFLSFTGEAPSDFHDKRLPTLDCNLFVDNGRILHTFYEKPMRSDKCLEADTALAEKSLKASLRQEIIRRMTNLHLDLPIGEKISDLDSFYDKLKNSGHKHEYIRCLFVEALLKFENMVRKSKLDVSDPSTNPSIWQMILAGTHGEKSSF